MIKKTFIQVLIFLLLNSYMSFSQKKDSLSITLKDAVRKGLENNFGIRISKKDLEIAENNDSWGNAGLLPTVSLSADQINRFDNSENQYTAGREDSYLGSLSPGINIRLNLFKGFSVKITKQNLEHLKSLSEGKLQLMLENTVADIVNAYNLVLSEEEKLKVAEELMNLSKDRYRYILTKKDLGLSVTYQVLQEKNSFLTDSANYLSELADKENAMRELCKLLGDTKIFDYKLTDSLKIIDKVFDLSELENQMYRNNASLNIQNTNLQIAENNIKSAKSSLYPSLSLNAGADQSNSIYTVQSNSDYSYSYGAYANLTLLYSVFNGNSRKRAIDNAKIETEKNRLKIDELKMILRNNLYNLYEMYKIRKQMLKVAQENYYAAKLNLKISKEKYKSGIINSFNFRDVQIRYMNAAFVLSQSKYFLNMSYNDLLKITGRILEEYK